MLTTFTELYGPNFDPKQKREAHKAAWSKKAKSKQQQMREDFDDPDDFGQVSLEEQLKLGPEYLIKVDFALETPPHSQRGRNCLTRCCHTSAHTKSCGTSSSKRGSLLLTRVANPSKRM
jgi:hypothetical protein